MPESKSKWLDELNPEQRRAVTHGEGPLLVVAGAGTGKTRTLAHRVAYLISQGVAPERILLLTFTRRAATEMLRRASSILRTQSSTVQTVWGGTFHGVANRLLRLHARSAGLSPDFTIIDRADAEDMLGVVRQELSLSSKETRFPRKSTCLDIYSRRINRNEDLDKVLREDFPWCREHRESLSTLFREYTKRKQDSNVLDYDDLLLYWYHMLQDPAIAANMGGRFEHILVDEYQDTNSLQARVLLGMRSHNRNITVVGDDAQSIYRFRSATVRNILDFPDTFPGATTVTLEQNYRSTQPILDTTNRVIAQARERHCKELRTEREGGASPQLITCQDETEQDEQVIGRVLEHYEQGVLLRHQAVLFRAAHHSTSLEIELSHRGIPYRKYGGLRFLEAAHIKDLLGFLRIMENPRDQIAWFRVLQLLPGVGPATAEAAFGQVSVRGLDTLRDLPVSAPVREELRRLVNLLLQLQTESSVAAQIEAVYAFYSPLMEKLYEDVEPRQNDLLHLSQLARRYSSRPQFLADLVLDPPVSTGDFAGVPVKDEDWLVLSTIHSAKGLEWDAVYLIHAADGNLPSDLATGSREEIEEELRLTYVALTRARDFLYVLWPLRYYHRAVGLSDRHSYAQCSRFFTDDVRALMELVPADGVQPDDDIWSRPMHSSDIARRLLDLWR